MRLLRRSQRFLRRLRPCLRPQGSLQRTPPLESGGVSDSCARQHSQRERQAQRHRGRASRQRARSFPDVHRHVPFPVGFMNVFGCPPYGKDERTEGFAAAFSRPRGPWTLLRAKIRVRRRLRGAPSLPSQPVPAGDRPSRSGLASSHEAVPDQAALTDDGVLSALPLERLAFLLRSSEKASRGLLVRDDARTIAAAETSRQGGPLRM